MTAHVLWWAVLIVALTWWVAWVGYRQGYRDGRDDAERVRAVLTTAKRKRRREPAGTDRKGERA